MSLEGGPFHCCLLTCAVAIPLDLRSRRRCAGLACAPSLDGADVEKWIKVGSKCDILNHFDRRQLLPGVNIKPSAPLSLEVGSS